MPEASTITDTSVPLGRIPVGVRGKRLNLLILDWKSKRYRWRFDITHILYGDSQFFSPYPKSREHKIVGTIHLSVKDIVRKRPNLIETLKRLDGVIALSSGQARELKKLYDIDARFIPHGFLSPSFARMEALDIAGRRLDESHRNVFFSGTNYRDYDTLFTVLNSLTDERNIEFHCVGQNVRTIERLLSYPNVRCYNRLSDDEYYTLLSSCDLNFLPLTYATANNALMEAQTIGIPSILPKIEGVADYAAPDPMNRFYASAEEASAQISGNGISRDPRGLVAFSIRFHWDTVADEIREYYSNLLGCPIRPMLETHGIET